MDILKQLNWRYATKKFDSTKILPVEKLELLKNAFNLTALSYGLQTLKLVVVKDKTVRAQLVEYSYGQHQVLDASHLLILCIQDEIDTDDIEEHFTNVKHIRNTPDTILDPFKAQLKNTISNMPEATKEDWAKRQAYIALGNLMTVCAIEEIDSCPMEGFLPQEIDRVLDLGSYGLKSVLLLPVGYRAEDDMFANLKKVRKQLNQTVIEL
ncbi:MAG: NAD(P)H-dependent oxidoreductase [Winogradskyella sp.]|uniref:NAD(P)H-dependent oxidoreductase n=1 Tax=Winogradskyella sp. TaxID=1883156 RepID=UPI000F3EE264|nr:NAD(P)H-dependent oxidoreductase [Winogradskyella sp.]RNC86436.1 MAG: NAD(P)H-dependent oxidoreductase [Winogradskyella sp.]